MATAGAACPHCRAPLDADSTFCAVCGRRVAGWRGDVTAPVAAAETAAELVGGDVETRQMQVSPQLLRAAGKAAKAAQAEPASATTPPNEAPDQATDSQLLRSVHRSPWWGRVGLVLIAVAAALGVYRWKHRAPPAPVTMSAPSPPPPSPILPSVNEKTKSKKPRRLSAETIGRAPSSPSSSAPKVVDGTKPGLLPKKSGATDSAAAPASASSAAAATAPTVAATPPPAPIEEIGTTPATPMTAAEIADEDQGRANADQVRFVVKQHLPQVRACYERAFKQEDSAGSAHGRLEVTFAIAQVDDTGKAKRVHITLNTLNTTGSDLLGKCIESLVTNWTFPRPVGGEFELTYPFVF